MLTGLQSDDLGYGQTGVILAELLGLPHATIIMQVEKLDGAIRVKRELEDGWFQHVEMPLPALLTIQSRHQQAALRHADGHQESQEQGSEAGDGGGSGRARRRTARSSWRACICPSAPSRRSFSKATRRKRRRKLVEKLKFEARVI